MHGFKHFLRGSFRDVPPSHGKAKASLRFIQTPQRRFKAETSIA
jgi:hypothetical protein